MPPSGSNPQRNVFLTGPDAISDHLAAEISPLERAMRTVRFVLCDQENRVLVHCPVHGEGPPRDEAQCVQVVSLFAGTVAHADAALVVVLTRPGPDSVTEWERLWFRAAHVACAEHEVRLLGVHLLTPTGQREVHHDDA
jgi:hypothetical protein